MPKVSSGCLFSAFFLSGAFIAMVTHTLGPAVAIIFMTTWSLFLADVLSKPDALEQLLATTKERVLWILACWMGCALVLFLFFSSHQTFSFKTGMSLTAASFVTLILFTLPHITRELRTKLSKSSGGRRESTS